MSNNKKINKIPGFKMVQQITPEFINPVIIYPLSFFATIIAYSNEFHGTIRQVSMTGCNLEGFFELLGLHSHTM